MDLSFRSLLSVLELSPYIFEKILVLLLDF